MLFPTFKIIILCIIQHVEQAVFKVLGFLATGKQGST